MFLGTEITHPNGHKVNLGSIDISYLTLPGINRIRARLMRESEEKGGASGTSYINCHIRSARAGMTWGLDNMDGLAIQANPFCRITLDSENQRARYVTDEEYMEQHTCHLSLTTPISSRDGLLKLQGSSLTISLQMVTWYAGRKTRKTISFIYTPRLEAVRGAASAYPQKVRAKGKWLIPSTNGNKLTKDTLQSAMADLKKRMRECGKSDICWNLHDLKRKGISDAKDSRIGGHKSDHIRQRYMVKLERY